MVKLSSVFEYTHRQIIFTSTLEISEDDNKIKSRNCNVIMARGHHNGYTRIPRMIASIRRCADTHCDILVKISMLQIQLTLVLPPSF